MNGKFFWIFRSLDYQNWVEIKDGVSVLVLCGLPILEEAASHIVRELKGNTTADLVLHFFYGSTIHKPLSLYENTMNRADLSCVWTLLMQVIDNCPQQLQNSLLEDFFGQILDFIAADEVAEMLLKKPMEAFESVLSRANLQNVWDSLAQVLKMSEEERRRGTESRYQNTQWNKRNLKFVFALDNRPIKAFQSLLDIICYIVYNLRRHFLSVKVVVIYPSSASDLRLNHSVVLLEYDKERQGMVLTARNKQFYTRQADLSSAECLRTLYFHNIRYENISRHLDYTFEWLWGNPEYEAWKQVEHSSLLFIEGKPGSGKSTLVKYFRDRFFGDYFMSRSHNPDQTLVADFFYSHRNGELERSHYNMLRALLYDILTADESFFIHFQEVFRRGGGCNISWLYEDLKDILMACVKHPLKRNIFLIVDAMDESHENDRRDIAFLLQKLSDPMNTKCVVKVFLASRPINDLHHDLMDSCNRILLQEENRGDIEKYTDDFLGDRVFCRVEGFKKHAKEYIAKCADGVFLWVSLIRKDLVRYVNQGRNVNQLMAFLKGLPKELESYYVCMLEELHEQNSNEDDSNITDGRRILQFCLFSHRAVELVELDYALGIPGLSFDLEPDGTSWETERPTDIRKRVTHCTGNFVEIRNRPICDGESVYLNLFVWHELIDHPFQDTKEYAIVQAMHQTVREFFLRPHNAILRSPLDVANIQAAFVMIQLTCVRYLTLHYKELVLKFRKPEDNWSSEDVCYFIQYLDKRPFIKYSLECLTRLGGDIDPEIALPLSDLINNIQNSLPSSAFCLLKRLAGSRTDSANVRKQVNDLLWIAVKQGNYVAIGNLLAAAAASDSVDQDKQTLLHIAANKGHAAVSRLLLDNGTDIEAKDNSRKTPLHQAASKGQEATVRVLLDHGANKEAKDNCLQTPLRLATINWHLATFQLLFDHGANIEAKDGSNLTMLYLAATNGQEATVQLLLNHSANMEFKDNLGRTPLHLATLNGHEAIVRVLLDYGANMEAKDDFWWTPLYLAASKGHEGTVRELLDRGAYMEAKDDIWWTPLYLAASNGHDATVQLLLDRGANDTYSQLH